MSAIRAKDTSPEMTVRRPLSRDGLSARPARLKVLMVAAVFWLGWR